MCLNISLLFCCCINTNFIQFINIVELNFIKIKKFWIIKEGSNYYNSQIYTFSFIFTLLFLSLFFCLLFNIVQLLKDIYFHYCLKIYDPRYYLMRSVRVWEFFVFFSWFCLCLITLLWIRYDNYEFRSQVYFNMSFFNDLVYNIFWAFISYFFISIFFCFYFIYIQISYFFAKITYLDIIFYNFTTGMYKSASFQFFICPDIELGLDAVSLVLLTLSAFIMLLSLNFIKVEKNWEFCNLIVNFNNRYYSENTNTATRYFEIVITSYCVYFTFFFLLYAFTTWDLIYFYIAFESTLIPIMILIGCFGSRARKIKAIYYIVLYTLAGSIFLLFSILLIYSEIGSTSIYMLQNYHFDSYIERILWCFFFLGFGVKVPLVPFHLWLIEAHVEAPTIGSVLLASLILKLGGYGMFRILIGCFPASSYYFCPIVFTVCTVGVLYGSFTAFRQTDVKKIVAYSSVVHMNFAIMGLFCFNYLALLGFILMMLGHGLISGAFFFLIGILYRNHRTRLYKYFSGITTKTPLFSIFFFFFSLANIALPGTINFIPEFLILQGLFGVSGSLFFYNLIGIFTSTTFVMWLVCRMLFGNVMLLSIKKFKEIDLTDFFVMLPLFFWTIFFGFYPKPIIDILTSTVYFYSNI